MVQSAIISGVIDGQLSLKMVPNAIKSEVTDFDTTVILADAERRAEILRGEGDAEKNGVLAKAYGKDFRFFDMILAFSNPICLIPKAYINFSKEILLII